MAWFNGSSKKKDDAREAGRIAREVGEMLDPYGERSLILEDDKAIIQPGRILQNIHTRMERVDLDPNVGWSPKDLMSREEGLVMFLQLGMGEMVVTAAAWYARQILARWPAEFVEHAISPEARIEMFLEGPKIEPADGDIARKVLNRALASAEEVEMHPELADLAPERLMAVWFALVFWFAIKSDLLHQQASAH